jgi:hypothetical protein
VVDVKILGTKIAPIKLLVLDTIFSEAFQGSLRKRGLKQTTQKYGEQAKTDCTHIIMAGLYGANIAFFSKKAMLCAYHSFFF